MRKLNKALDEALSSFSETMERLKEVVERSFSEEFFEKLKNAAEFAGRAELLDRSGWLGHTSTPFDLIDDPEGDPEAVSKLVEEYYKNNWPSVRKEIEGRLKRFNLDDEAKNALLEAMDCHERGLYRAVPRLIFPEIERVSRKEIHSNELGTITSQEELKDFAGNLALQDLDLKNFLSYLLYKRLIWHFYEKAHTQERIKQLEKDPVPNRHATIHGLVIYKTHQNSLNAIFTADYIFQIINRIKAERREGGD